MKLRRAGSHHLISSELLIGIITIANGYAGFFGTGSLHVLLERFGLHVDWGVVLIGGGLSLSVLAIAGWFAKADRTVMWLCYARSYVNVLAAVWWTYIFYLVTSMESLQQVFAVWVMAGVSPIFCSVSWFENRKAAVALDEHKKTPDLIYEDRRF